MFKSNRNPAFRNEFSENIFDHKYAHEGCETMEDLANTLVDDVCEPLSKEDRAELKHLIATLKFIPGGRYLYYAGRTKKFFNNCFLLKAEEDSREDWASLSWRVESCLMTGGGIGVDYSTYRGEGSILKSTGGVASGPLPKMMMMNEIGRHVMQGGSRRSALYASLNWQHPDIEKFLHVKNWHDMKVAGTDASLSDVRNADFNFPAPLDMTNISVNYDTEWLLNYYNTGDPGEVFRTNVRQALRTAEPGFSFNFFDKENETLRNAPVSADTWVLTDDGYKQIRSILEQKVNIWTGSQYAETEFVKTKSNVETVAVHMSGSRLIKADPDHEFLVERWDGKGKHRKLLKIDRVAASDLKENDVLHVSYNDSTYNVTDDEYYWYGYAYGDGSFKNASADITFCTEESKQCAKDMGIDNYCSSVNWNDSRGFVRAYMKSEFFRGKGKDLYPYGELTEDTVMSFLAGLFDADGSYDKKHKAIRLASVHKGFLEGVRRELEELGIMSGITSGGISSYGKKEGWLLCVYRSYNDRFKKLIPTVRIQPDIHAAYRKSVIRVIKTEEGPVEDVYCCDVGVPEHSFMAEGVIISNCTEVTSEDDSDVCNLGSINMSRIESLEEFKEVCTLATKFLMCGAIKAELPYEKVKAVRERNMRIGVGLMGIHEWLLKRGSSYEVTPELHKYLDVYRGETNKTSREMAQTLGCATPVAVRAIAPTGSIGILAGTTTGIEPLFAVAYKRRYLKGKNRWHYQYVVDSAAQEMIDLYGVNPNLIESALDLADNYEKRMKFQADVQDYVDMAISSTINLPAWRDSPQFEKDFTDTLASYAPRLRGFTCYPDGARGGQPLTAVPYDEAKSKLGEEFEEALETHDICSLTQHGGSCGV